MLGYEDEWGVMIFVFNITVSAKLTRVLRTCEPSDDRWHQAMGIARGSRVFPRGSNAVAWAEAWLKSNGLNPDEIPVGEWPVHPGFKHPANLREVGNYLDRLSPPPVQTDIDRAVWELEALLDE